MKGSFVGVWGWNSEGGFPTDKKDKKKHDKKKHDSMKKKRINTIMHGLSIRAWTHARIRAHALANMRARPHARACMHAPCSGVNRISMRLTLLPVEESRFARSHSTSGAFMTIIIQVA